MPSLDPVPANCGQLSWAELALVLIPPAARTISEKLPRKLKFGKQASFYPTLHERGTAKPQLVGLFLFVVSGRCVGQDK